MNPYYVLGVKETATKEEIKAAYRELVKKYHPDKYTDEQMKARATEKIKEINMAYDEIMNGKSAGQSTSYDYNRGYSGAYSGPKAQDFAEVEKLIYAGRYEEAMVMLDRMTLRNARWNYLYGVISMELHRHDAAARFFEAAYRFEPDNVEYRNAYQSTHMDGRSYTHRYGGGSSYYESDECCDCCNLLCTIWCMNAMCNSCMRGCC